MNTKESLPHALGRKALDAMIRREYDGWPPKTQWSLYQPHRPEKKPSEPKDQSKNRLKSNITFYCPLHPVCNGHFFDKKKIFGGKCIKR